MGASAPGLARYDEAYFQHDTANPASTIRLKKNQWEVFHNLSRFLVIVAGRRWGKTYLAVAKMLEMACSKSNSTTWYIAPTYKQAKLIVWKILKRNVPEQARLSCNEQELTIILKNGSEISLKGADNPDSLRGAGLDFAIFDEFQDMHLSVWTEVVRPMLATTRGKAMFIGTPKGFNHFYDIYMAAQGAPEQWKSYHFNSFSGGYIPEAEILAAKNDPTITEREFKQEWEASFENLTGRVYDMFGRLAAPHGNIRGISIHEVMASPLPILWGLDFNVDPMTASFAVKQGKDLQFFYEISIRNSGTQEMCDAVKMQFPGRRVVCYPDPAGNSRSTKAPVGTTDYTIIRRAGFQVYNPGRAYGLADKINTLNAALKSANGERHAFFDPINCRKTIKALDGLCYKEGTKIPDKGSGLDHYADNVAYLVCGVKPIKGGQSGTQEFRV